MKTAQPARGVLHRSLAINVAALGVSKPATGARKPGVTGWNQPESGQSMLGTFQYPSDHGHLLAQYVWYAGGSGSGGGEIIRAPGPAFL